MPPTTKKLSREEFVTYRRSFDTNKYLVDPDIANIIDGEIDALITELDGKDADEIAKSRRVPRFIGENYEGWMDSEKEEEDNDKLISELTKVCSAPELLKLNPKIWLDVQKNKTWCDFNNIQEEGYELGGHDDDFTDIGTGSLLNEDLFLDIIAGVTDADEED